MIVLDYALDDGEVQLARYKPEGIEELSRTTKFTRKELQIIYRGFKQVATSTYSLPRPYTKIYIFFRNTVDRQIEHRLYSLHVG